MNVNSLVHLKDVEFFLNRFKELAEPLGAVLNTEKTRVLTSTNMTSTISKLLSHDDPDHRETGLSLQRAVSTFSTTIIDDQRQPVEVIDGLRVLGVPVGSTTFCNAFLMKAIAKAMKDSESLLNGLDDLQTILRLFSICTVHKMTHLFSSDVASSPICDLPTNFYLWESPMTEKFTEMTNSMLSSITECNDIPDYSQIITNLSLRQGGLGLQHPRANAISSFMTSTKRCLQYTHQGVWLGFNKPRPFLPHSITSLFNEWESSDSKHWVIFRKYLDTFAEICYQDAEDPSDFIFKASLNGCREKAKEFASEQIRDNVLLLDSVTPPHVRRVLPAMLDSRSSLALMTMSRIEPKHRIKNENFVIALKRKLRLKIWTDPHHFVCKCGKSIDAYGDHSLGCRLNSKTAASNGIRDGLIHLFQRLLPIVKLTSSSTQIESEAYNIVRPLPRLKPFDLSIRLDHLLVNGAFKSPFARIGFDVTLIHSTKPSISSNSEAATFHETDLRLRDGEKGKFARARGGTNKETLRTLTADEVIGSITDSNFCFIPIAVGPFGELGSIFRRFWEGIDPLPLPFYPDDRPNALKAAKLALSNKTPRDILQVADDAWRRDHGTRLFGGNYLSPTPSVWANQQLGLVCLTHLSNHIRCSFQKVSHRPFDQHCWWY